jgi:hypothetical protein
METSRNVWEVAACLVHDHAFEALLVAERNLETSLRRSPDDEMAVMWEQVLGAIEEFFRAEPHNGERLH